jgi:hypothetical protein
MQMVCLKYFVFLERVKDISELAFFRANPGSSLILSVLQSVIHRCCVVFVCILR